MKALSLFAAFACFANVALAADKVTIRAEVSQTQIAATEQLSLEITVVVDGTSNDPAYTPPELDNLDIVRRGTQRGQSFQMNFGSAPRVQLSTTYTYLLQPKKPGKAKIGAASARIGNEMKSTEPIFIEVTGKAGPGQKPGQQAPTPAIPQPQDNKGRSDPVMLRVVPDKFEAFVGEQVVLSVFLLSRVELSDVQSLTQPQLEGVLLERDDKPRQNLQPKIQRYGGEEYQVFEIARYALFALREGKVNVGAFATEAQAGGLFFSQGRSYRVSSLPIEIEAKPLPQTGRPSGFSQMNVGDFQFGAQLVGNDRAQVGKPVTLRVIAAGTGNVSKLTLPAPRLSAKLKAYDPETKSEQKFDQGSLAGRIQRDYLFVPNEPGEHLIPPLVFNWFDPKTGTYKEAKSQPFSIQVGGESVAAAPNEPAQAAKASGDGRNLHAIRFSAKIKDDRPAPARTIFVWIGSATSALAALAVVLGRFQRREKSKAEIARDAKANAQRGIKKARTLQGEAFYAELARVARVYLSERYGISIGVGRDGLRAAMIKEGVDEAAIDRLLTELDNCDFARFAPGGHLAREAEQAGERLEQVIARVDKPGSNE